MKSTRQTRLFDADSFKRKFKRKEAKSLEKSEKDTARSKKKKSLTAGTKQNNNDFTIISTVNQIVSQDYDDTFPHGSICIVLDSMFAIKSAKIAPQALRYFNPF